MCAVLVLAACGSDDPATPEPSPASSTTSAATTSTPSPSTTDAPTTTAASTTTTVADTTADIDPAPLLAAALDAIGTRYRYTSAVSTDGVVSTSVEGVIFDDAFSAVIVTADATVEYRKTADGEWTRGEDGEWVALEEPAPVSDPVAPLRSPLGVELIGEADGQTAVVATYAGVDLGVDLDTIDVAYRIVDGVVAAIAYEATVGGSVVAVTTEIFDVGLVDPISSPDI